MKVYMKRPVTRTYEVQFGKSDLRGWLAECSTPTGVGDSILTIESVTHNDGNVAGSNGIVLRILLTETSNI